MTSAAISLPKEGIKSRVNTTLGMVFFIGSWSMSFGTLFLAFAVLRQRSGVWPPVGIALPSLPMATLATAVLIASSVAFHRALQGIDAKDSNAVRADGLGLPWIIGLVTGVAFALLQGWLWMDLMAAGRNPSSGLYESLFYGLTWVHALHVGIGLLSLLWATIGLAAGRYGSHRFSTINNIVIFWHFVDVVWIVLYLAFFIF